MDKTKNFTVEMFDLATEKLLKQGVRSTEEGTGRCLYRSKVGCCWAGYLIADKHYSINLEFNTTQTEEVRKAINLSNGFELIQEDIAILRKGQWIHDSKSVEEWPKLYTKLRAECFPEAKPKVFRLNNGES